METKYIDVKSDCMWNGNCDHKLAADTYKMDLFSGKSSLQGYLNDELFSLCSNQDNLLDELLEPDFGGEEGPLNSHTMNDIQTSQSAAYYSANYPNQFANGHSNDAAMTNQLHQPNGSQIKVTLASSNSNHSLAVSTFNSNNGSNHPLNSSLNS